jgi:hypothetical protein
MNYLSEYASETEKMRIVSEALTDFSQWTLKSLVDNAVSNSFQVYTNMDSAVTVDKVVTISEENISYFYNSLGTKWLFKNKGYHRVARGELHLAIQENDGKIVFSQFISEIYQDTITSKSIKYIEDPNLTFTKGEKTNSSFGKNIVGPVLFTAATLTVVYLFYSLRSDN